MPRSKTAGCQAASLGSARHHSNPLPTPSQASPVCGRAAAGCCGLRPLGQPTCASDRLCQQHTFAPWRFRQRRLATRGFHSATSATFFLFNVVLLDCFYVRAPRVSPLQCPLAQCSAPQHRWAPSTAVPCRRSPIILEPLRLGARKVPQAQQGEIRQTRGAF